ncbi:MAG: energy transducer TonB [Flavobacteriaceae bacterium]
MKIITSISLCLALFSIAVAKGQMEKVNCISSLDSVLCKTVYLSVDKMPIPKGGERILNKELIQNLNYQIDSSNTIGSRVFVSFVVEIDGKISGKRIIQNISGTDLANQALSIVDNLKWVPGSCDGKKVPVLYKLPINICIK